VGTIALLSLCVSHHRDDSLGILKLTGREPGTAPSGFLANTGFSTRQIKTYSIQKKKSIQRVPYIGRSSEIMGVTRPGRGDTIVWGSPNTRHQRRSNWYPFLPSPDILFNYSIFSSPLCCAPSYLPRGVPPHLFRFLFHFPKVSRFSSWVFADGKFNLFLRNWVTIYLVLYNLKIEPALLYIET